MKIPPFIKERSSNVEMAIHCQAPASKTEIVGIYGDLLKIRLAAAPVEGAANLELCQFLSKYFGVSRAEVQILSGKSARKKKVLIRGKTTQDIQEHLPQILK